MPKKTRAECLLYQREYGRTRRDPEKEKKRNALRRADPAYAAAQIERKRKWRAANKEKHLATSRAYDAKQLRENLQRRLSKNLRHRLCKAVKGMTRGISAVRDLGCTIAELKLHLEARFQPGMTWENYGRSGWHIDHVRPLILFDLSVPAEAAAAFHYTNLQPLWAEQNQRKATKPHPATWAGHWRNAQEAVAGDRVAISA